MTLFMPPIQRKKKVAEKYCPDSFRVISEGAIEEHPKFQGSAYRASFEPKTPDPQCYNGDQPLKFTRVLPRVLPDYRGNRPQALSCSFMDKNVRFLNEPMCNVFTEQVRKDEKKWWPSDDNDESEPLVPPHTEDTMYRTSYNLRQGERFIGSGRHTANEQREAAHGIVPVNYLGHSGGARRCYKEALSYEHIYNSRNDKNYPMRGRRRGSFVWNRMDPVSQKKFAEYYSKVEEEKKFEEMKQLASRNNNSAADKTKEEESPKVSPTAFTSAKLVSENYKSTADLLTHE